LSWCRRTRISASNAARDRNNPIKVHQINLQRSLIGSEYLPIRGRGQPFWVCGRDTRKKQSSVTVVADAIRFSYAIKTNEVFDTPRPPRATGQNRSCRGVRPGTRRAPNRLLPCRKFILRGPAARLRLGFNPYTGRKTVWAKERPWQR